MYLHQDGVNCILKHFTPLQLTPKGALPAMPVQLSILQRSEVHRVQFCPRMSSHISLFSHSTAQALCSACASYFCNSPLTSLTVFDRNPGAVCLAHGDLSSSGPPLQLMGLTWSLNTSFKAAGSASLGWEGHCSSSVTIKAIALTV